MDFVFSPADIMLPVCDMEKWATIACDQYTSEPEYWQKAYDLVGESPSALNLILPEVYLKSDNTADIERINLAMKQYIEKGVFKTYKDSLVYIERTQSDGLVRRGIIGKIDLEQYDYSVKTDKAVRATEKTVIERIPPRVKIRENASLELPHIMLLIDDSKRTVVEKTAQKTDKFEKLYDFDLMLGGGHIKGFLIDKDTSSEIIDSLKALSDENNGFLFSVGDGNHSLATAKECYNKNQTESSRYALAEIVNIHDDALKFEPIYRVVFGVEPQKLISDFSEYCGGEYSGADAQVFDCIFGKSEKKISVKGKAKLSVGTLQDFLDTYLADNPNAEIDYIHGEESLKKISDRESTVGFIFDGMEKCDLFPAVAADGSLPRKTFSMGHADDKRFYIEARTIK